MRKLFKLPFWKILQMFLCRLAKSLELFFSRNVFIPQLYNISISSNGSETFHELALIENVSSNSPIEFFHFMKTDLCPDNFGSFRQNVEFKFIVERRLYTNDGSSIEIFDNQFCLEEFYEPKQVL